MNFIYIGKIVNTHGIKGEIRIISDFKYKDLVFKKDFKVYIGKNKDEEVIQSYRHHKQFDMICLNGIDSIDDCLKYKGENIYINRDDITDIGYFDEDLFGMDVYSQNGYIGKVTDILKGVKNDILVVDENKLIPNIDEFVKNVDLDNKKITIEEIEGLINED